MQSKSDFWNALLPYAKKQTFPKRTILLEEGKRSNKVYWIEKGCLRLSFNKDGQDISFQFFFEGEAISSIESLKHQKPSLFSIETIEASTLYGIDSAVFLQQTEQNPTLQKFVNETLYKRLYHYQKLFLSRIKDSPEERYKDLLSRQPNIVQRIPQHYIASYLGITAVSLSRIRNRI